MCTLYKRVCGLYNTPVIVDTEIMTRLALLSVVVAVVAVCVVSGQLAEIPNNKELTDYKTKSQLRQLLFQTPFLDELLRCAVIQELSRSASACPKLVNDALLLLPDFVLTGTCFKCTNLEQPKLLRNALILVNQERPNQYTQLSDIFRRSG